MKILIVLHKSYSLPVISPVYQPIQVGDLKTIDQSYYRDNTGDNISVKNKTFCELTALYWAWKNMNTDILGLCHYRRYLGNGCVWKKKQERLLKEQDITSLLRSSDIILPRKRHYWIETRESQYVHAHHAKDLQVTEMVLQEKYPSFLPAWRHTLASRSGHICNMFITRHELFSEYCSWLFDILFEVEKRLDISSYSENDQRVFGFLGERLLDVWVETKQLRYVETPVINLEKQKWIKKGALFIQRKFHKTNG
jgi:hypothetical protein